jgi:hypothetical protein
METIPTNKGQLSIGQILDELAYSSYATQRNYGCSHELLAKNGLGNDQFKERYESELK